MFWYPSQAAFRAGVITEEQWDEANIGGASVAFGSDTTASGAYSVAMGTNVTVFGTSAIWTGAVLDCGRGTVRRARHVRGSDSGSGRVVRLRRFVWHHPPLDRAEPVPRARFGWHHVLLELHLVVWRDAGAQRERVVIAVGCEREGELPRLNGADVLAKLAEMPIREWNYKAQDAAVRNAGPRPRRTSTLCSASARCCFGISTIDADGIALAAVKALALENAGLKAELAALRERLDRLEGRER